MKWIRAATFCVIGVCLLYLAQCVLTPDVPAPDILINRMRRGEQALPKDSIDVLFLGTSNAVNSFSPMQLYEEQGIVSYNSGTAGQPAMHSYYFLEEAFDRQSPSFVIWDVEALFNDQKVDSQWRYTLDTTRFSLRKIWLAKAYAEIVEGGDVWSALFPIMKYHTRWDQLTKEDFKISPIERDYSAGYLVTSNIIPVQRSLEEIDANADSMLAMKTGIVECIVDGVLEKQEIDQELYSVEICERSLEYMLKMKTFCEEHDAQLILVKAPKIILPQISYSHAWTRESYIQTKVLAEKYGLPYYDFMYDTDIGLNLATDFIDGGFHLKCRGAVKVTRALGTYLVENFDVPRRQDAGFDADLVTYHRIMNVANLQSETNFNAYIDRLIENQDKWTIVMATNDEYKIGLDEQSIAHLAQLGLTMISGGEYGHSYAALIDRGTVKFEERSDRRIEYSEMVNDISYDIVSSGWYTWPLASIQIDETEYAINSRGINIVVYDNESGAVIDTVCFDTWAENKLAVRNNQELIREMLRGYEAFACAA